MAKTIVCIATPLYPPQIGGPATHVALLEHALPASDFSLRVAKFSSVLFLPKVLRHIAYFFAVATKAAGADVVYALDPVSVGLPALFAARVLGKKFVLRVGGDYAWEQGTQRFGVVETLDEFAQHPQSSSHVRTLQRVQSYVACRAAAVVAPSQYLAGIVRTWGVHEKRIRVIYSQPDVAPANTTRSAARKALNIREDEEVVISSGRLVPWKGFEGLVDAMGHVRRQRQARLVIAGSGPGEETLRAHIEATNTAGFVTLLGDLPHDKLEQWLCASDVFALNTSYEGLSHTVLEAFAAGAPVVTTHIDGNLELVTDGETGLLVRPADTAALAANILRLLSDRAYALQLAEKAKASLVRFNKHDAIASLGSIFKAI